MGCGTASVKTHRPWLRSPEEAHPPIIGIGITMDMHEEKSIETIAERACIRADGLPVRIFERRHMVVRQTAAGPRRYAGARFWCTADGAAVRLIDSSIFELIESGELLVVLD